MGLLNSILGSVIRDEKQAAKSNGGGLAGLISIVASRRQLMQALNDMLSNDG